LAGAGRASNKEAMLERSENDLMNPACPAGRSGS